MKHLYPAIFQAAEEGGYTVIVPDLPGCISEGDTLEESMQMAVSAIDCWLDGTLEKDYPVPSDAASINLSDYPDSFVNIVEYNPKKKSLKYCKSEGLKVNYAF